MISASDIETKKLCLRKRQGWQNCDIITKHYHSWVLLPAHEHPPWQLVLRSFPLKPYGHDMIIRVVRVIP